MASSSTWAASFERAESPVADLTGERCAGHQSGDVWFLAGTYGTRRTFRSCRVPRDKHLFFPLINYGEPHADLARHRQVTRDCFDIGELASPPVRMYPSAANGYYAMLRPLPAGTHVIDLGGILPSMAQAVTYTLIVE